MINGFFKIVPNDIAYLSNMWGKQQSGKDLIEKEKLRVGCAAMRVFAALGMAFSFLKGTHAVLGNHLSKTVICVGLYAFTHDIFVISLNVEKAHLNKAVLIVKAIWRDVTGFFGGTKDDKDAPSHPYTEGTFFRSAWDAYFNSLKDSYLA